jgi:hypothetical protein
MRGSEKAVPALCGQSKWSWCSLGVFENCNPASRVGRCVYGAVGRRVRAVDGREDALQRVCSVVSGCTPSAGRPLLRVAYAVLRCGSGAGRFEVIALGGDWPERDAPCTYLPREHRVCREPSESCTTMPLFIKHGPRVPCSRATSEMSRRAHHVRGKSQRRSRASCLR